LLGCHPGGAWTILADPTTVSLDLVGAAPADTAGVMQSVPASTDPTATLGIHVVRPDVVIMSPLSIGWPQFGTPARPDPGHTSPRGHHGERWSRYPEVDPNVPPSMQRSEGLVGDDSHTVTRSVAHLSRTDASGSNGLNRHRPC
jgi:hypothetical protein